MPLQRRHKNSPYFNLFLLELSNNPEDSIFFIIYEATGRHSVVLVVPAGVMSCNDSLLFSSRLSKTIKMLFHFVNGWPLTAAVWSQDDDFRRL